MFDDLIRYHEAKDKRAAKTEGGIEHHLTEGAVMVAFGMHLLRTVPGLTHVSIHPDGEHAKQFPFVEWLAKQGFNMAEQRGSTAYGGVFRHVDGRSLLVFPKSGVRDVEAEHDGVRYVAECKGGVINSKHSGQLSRLRQGLCETVGLSLAADQIEGEKQFVVVPKTKGTASLAAKMSKRARAAGIEIALVDGRGNVEDVP